MVLNSYAACCLLVLGSGLIAVVGLLLARKTVNFEKLRSSHDVGGYLLAVAGTLYSVLLGLVVVDAMQNHHHAREITERETYNLADVFLLAQRLPEPKRTEIRKLCSSYTQSVIDTEWPLMSSATYCPIAEAKAIDLMELLMDFAPRGENEKDLYPQMVQEASQFWQNRQSRLNIAEKGIPTAEWVVLIAGALIVIFFTYLFGLENFRLQVIMTALVAILISLNLVLLLLFAYPFSGDLSIQSDAFNTVKGIFEK
jgi:hypothetical protein